ncbi:hypothetical protein NLU13_4720 [Sarocladium strictum]|uniref:FAD/NAD(P)-binding domain-containing protein n=1 Tax=Sarocladium strictum TaxID=5046 RepID=A0AA39GJR1_SARSR|nr:hypothetical protein NLU13_4720 [Sarocladium strictum]
MADQKNIVILGSSYAGFSVAHYLLRHAIPKLPTPSNYKIILVSPSTTFFCRPASPRALITDAAFPQDDLFRPIEPCFERYPSENFSFVHGKATSWDPDARTVVVDLSEGKGKATLTYHSLLVATGSGTPSPLMGVHDSDAALKKSWEAFRAALPSAKHIVIAGGGPTGIETAAELGEHLNGKPGWFAGELKDPKVKITVVTSGDHILPYLRSSIADKAEPLLAKIGVSIIKDTKVEAVSPPDAGSKTNVASKATISLQGGNTIEADLYIPSTGYIPSTSFVPPRLLAADGRIKVDPSTLRVPDAGDRVYALGDCSDYARQAIHLLLEAVPCAGNNMKRDLFLAEGLEKDAPAEKKYKEDTRETHLVPIGTSTGVGSAMGHGIPSFVVTMIKGKHYWLNTLPKVWSGEQWAKEA